MRAGDIGVMQRYDVPRMKCFGRGLGRLKFLIGISNWRLSRSNNLTRAGFENLKRNEPACLFRNCGMAGPGLQVLADHFEIAAESLFLDDGGRAIASSSKHINTKY